MLLPLKRSNQLAAEVGDILNYAPPYDIAIAECRLVHPDAASFDGIEFSEYTLPPLTTMWQDREAIGRGAVQLLVSMIEGTEQEPPPPLIVPTRLIVRKSTRLAFS